MLSSVLYYMINIPFDMHCSVPYSMLNFFFSLHTVVLFFLLVLSPTRSPDVYYSGVLFASSPT